MASQGWVSLHRSISEWEWINNPNVFRVFMDALLNANHKDNKYQGVMIKAGSYTTSVEKIAVRTGLSKQNVRTAINKLKLTNELTIETTSKYTLISITNWDKFQSANKPTNKPLTNDQQTTNKPLTTNNNVNNANNDNKYSFDEFYSKYPIKKSKQSTLKAWNKLNNDNQILAVELLDKFIKGISEGISPPHPSTYLNNKRWEDEPAKNMGEYSRSQKTPEEREAHDKEIALKLKKERQEAYDLEQQNKFSKNKRPEGLTPLKDVLKQIRANGS